MRKSRAFLLSSAGGIALAAILLALDALPKEDRPA